MERLAGWLERSRLLGFLGPGPITDHLRHAHGFAGVAGPAPGQALDLGSGGGVPGLVLADLWPDTPVVLLDSNERRTAFLEEAVESLGWAGRVHVVRARAEVAGHDPRWRAGFDLVVSRGFGPPPVAAECAAPFLVVGGRCIVSEPPEPPPVDRWPAEGLARLGMVAEAAPHAETYRYQVLRQAELCADHYARRAGIPAKRPLW